MNHVLMDSIMNILGLKKKVHLNHELANLFVENVINDAKIALHMEFMFQFVNVCATVQVNNAKINAQEIIMLMKNIIDVLSALMNAEDAMDQLQVIVLLVEIIVSIMVMIEKFSIVQLHVQQINRLKFLRITMKTLIVLKKIQTLQYIRLQKKILGRLSSVELELV